MWSEIVGEAYAKYKNLVEGVTFISAQYSTGLQFADFVAGAIFNRYELDDDKYFELFKSRIRSSPSGVMEGYGIVMVPKFS